jgi:hypothetical protein
MLPQSKERGGKGKKMNDAIEKEFEKTDNGPAYHITGLGASPRIPYVDWLENELLKERAALIAATLNTTSASTPLSAFSSSDINGGNPRAMSHRDPRFDF